MPCPIHADRCSPALHSPGGERKGSAPFRPGKTDRDHLSGAWARRQSNRVTRAQANKAAQR